MRDAAERQSPIQRVMACQTTIKLDLIRGPLEDIFIEKPHSG